MRNVKDFASDIQTEYSALSNRQIQGKGHAKGLEFDLTLNHHALYMRANYTLSESKRKFAEINNGKAFNPPYDVKHNVVINFSYQISPPPPVEHPLDFLVRGLHDLSQRNGHRTEHHGIQR